MENLWVLEDLKIDNERESSNFMIEQGKEFFE